jgi:hypothetical protein
MQRRTIFGTNEQVSGWRRRQLRSVRPYVIAEPTMPMTVLICGSPASGFQIIGLFANSADAQSYAEDYSLKDWWVAEVISPGAFAESRVATASKSHL